MQLCAVTDGPALAPDEQRAPARGDAPRSMDLDVLLYGDLVCDEHGLKLPRPDLLKRAYMLGPLAALAPEVVHPIERLTIGELWRRFDQAGHELVPVPAAPPVRP